MDDHELTAADAPFQRPATLLEELDAEAALVPNRRGALYALAAEEIRRLQHAAAANTPPTTAPGQCPMCGEYSMSARARPGLYGHTEQQDGA